MAGKKEVVLVFKAQTQKAQKDISGVGKSLKSVGKSGKVARGGLSMMGKGFKTVGMAMKAAGIGLFVSLLAQLTGLFQQNQKTADTFQRILLKLQPVFDAVGEVIGFVAGLLEDLIDMFMGAVGWIGKLIGVNMSATKSSEDFANSLVEQRKQVKLLEAELAMLQLQYQQEAEIMRQIRDDESLSIDERIKANYELGKVLAEQLRVERGIAEQSLKLAEMELSVNKDNIDLQTAVIEAKTKLAEIDERITGQRSEQLTNLNSLEREREAQNKEAAEKRKEQLEKEAELMQELIDLQNEDIRVKKKANKSLTEQIDSATEANEEQVKALKKKMEEELKWLKQQKTSSEENLKLQNEEIKKQEEELEVNEKIVQKSKESEEELVKNAASAAKIKLYQFNDFAHLMTEAEQKRFKELKRMNVESAEDLTAFTAEYQEVLGAITDAGYKHAGNNFMDYGAAVKEKTTEIGADLVGMEGEIQRTLANNSQDAIDNSQAIIDMSQASADESLNFINNYANAEAEIRERYGQQILDTEASLTDTTTDLKEQASDDLFLHFETAQQKEIRLATEKYDDLIGLAENDAEATAKLEKEKTDILEAINQKYIDEEEKKKKDFYNFKETEEISARQKELNDLTTHLDQILAIEGLTDEERLLAQEEFIRRSDEINANHDALDLEKKKDKQRELENMALAGMNTIVAISAEGARKELNELEKKFKRGEISEEQYNKQKNAIEKKQAKKERNAALIQIGVDTARGISAAVKAGAGLTFPANLGAIASGVLAVLSGVAGAKAAMNDASSVGDVDTGGIDDGDDDTGDVPRLAFGDITSDAPPVQAFVVESDVSGAQALQSELDLQSTL